MLTKRITLINYNKLSMQCHCRSKDLYRDYDKLSFPINGQTHSQTRKIQNQAIPAQQQKILSNIYENSQIYLPTRIDKIQMQQIYASPLWFYKNYIGMNRPCIISDALDGQIVQKWSNAKQFAQITQQFPQISVSLTPDGFADSIKNQYFIEPYEQKLRIKDVIDWKQNESQNNKIKSDWIPYIQHQNSNLTNQINSLTQFIDQDSKNFISLHYFQGNQPDASNFWMGYRDSVSSLHKDPYENFYTTISGQKHFTLLPPVSIIQLQQQEYKTAKWKINEDNKFVAQTDPNSTYPTTRWICCNPDLDSDYQKFPMLKQLNQYKHHVVLQAGQTLYLPSLWYHQVSQTHDHSPYTIAINYWFDMNFSQNYSLYQATRKIKGYP